MIKKESVAGQISTRFTCSSYETRILFQRGAAENSLGFMRILQDITQIHLKTDFYRSTEERWKLNGKLEEKEYADTIRGSQNLSTPTLPGRR